MGRMYDRDIANRALDKLLDRRKNGFGGFITTKHLFNACKFNYTDDGVEHGPFREVLKRLHKCGLILRTGTSSFAWKLRDEHDTWDRSYPFKRLETAPKDDGYTTGKLSSTPSWNRPKPAVSTYADTPLNGDYVLKTDHEAALKSTGEILAAMAKQLLEKDEKIARFEKDLEEWKHAAKSHVRVLEVKHFDKTTHKLKNVVLPKVFDRVKALAECRRNVLLVGPAGCGKTHLGHLVAKTLKLKFGSISCTAGMSEAHLLGRATPNTVTGENVFQGSSFLSCFEEGGLFLLDELDAADPNMLLAINTALANGYCNVPNRPKKPRAAQHDDFVCVATANTFGKGATRMYSGRNQLDEATLDRFRIGIVECDYDPAVEMAVCPDEVLRTTLQGIRTKIEAATGLRRIMSTRFLRDAYVMASQGGWDKQAVLDAYFEGWTPEEMAKVA